MRTQFPALDTEVDAGVGPDTVHNCAGAGASMIVSGTTIMSSEEPRSVINLLRYVRNILLIDETQCLRDEIFSLENKNRDYQIISQLRQRCFPV